MTCSTRLGASTSGSVALKRAGLLNKDAAPGHEADNVSVEPVYVGADLIRRLRYHGLLMPADI
jgi:hypothetical protein